MDTAVEQKELVDFQKWAQARTRQEVNTRIREMVKTNELAAEMLAVVNNGPSDDEGEDDVSNQQTRPDIVIMTNHTGYTHIGSQNWEHDDTGAASNYSGVMDITLNAQADHEGWQAGYDYSETGNDPDGS